MNRYPSDARYDPAPDEGIFIDAKSGRRIRFYYTMAERLPGGCMFCDDGCCEQRVEEWGKARHIVHGLPRSVQ